MVFLNFYCNFVKGNAKTSINFKNTFSSRVLNGFKKAIYLLKHLSMDNNSMESLLAACLSNKLVSKTLIEVYPKNSL